MEEQLNAALELMHKKNFEEAKTILFNLRKENLSDPVVNYQIGMLYNNYDNPDKSIEAAKRYFQYAISNEYVVEAAYLELAKLEKNNSHAIRLIRKGLEVFLGSIDLYERLLLCSDQEKREEVYKEIESKDLLSDEVKAIMMDTYYRLNKYENVLSILDQISLDKQDEVLVKTVIKAYCFLELGKIKLAQDLFAILIQEDINNELNYAPYFGEMICCFREDNIENALGIFAQIPDDHEINTQIFVYPILDFDFKKYFLNALSILETKMKNKKDVMAKIRGLRGLFLFSISNENITSKVIKDLEYADRHSPSNSSYCYYLKFIYEDKEKYIDAYKFCMKHIKNSSKEKYRRGKEDRYWKFIIDCDTNILLQISDNFFEFISNEIHYNHDKYTITILNPLIERLFKEKQYKEIIKIVELLNTEYIEQTDILFEIAYSYSEIEKFLLAIKYYEKYENKVGVTSASANNLGLLYEKFNDLSSAQQLFKKAMELNPESKNPKNNFNRVNSLLEIKEKESFEMKKAASDFLKEDVWIKSKVISFSKYKDLHGLIICPYKQLPQFFGVNGTVATELIKTLLDKKYILKVTDHNLKTSSSVYKISDAIDFIIKEIETNDDKEKELINIARKISMNAFEEIGYDNQLLDSLNKIGSVDLQAMLKRDLKENALAFITTSYKTSLVMSGSIIEAILLDKINSKKINSYQLENGKNKKINQMDINELLFVSNKEGIIDNQMFHLSHALRFFRNLIHPGVEQRKAAIHVTDANAELAWNIVRKIIIEI